MCKNSYILSLDSASLTLNLSPTLTSIQLENFPSKPPERFPSSSFSPNKNLWNLSDEAAIPADKPIIEPIIGPPGNVIAGNKPTP